jgi:hypothetical protein
MSETSLTPIEEVPSNSNASNAAVLRCCQARDRAMYAVRAQNLDRFEIKQRGGDAYRDALPHLSGYENIRDFIACVSHGMITEDIRRMDGPGLLYAAQVAISALRLAPKDPKEKKSRAA